MKRTRLSRIQAARQTSRKLDRVQKLVGRGKPLPTTLRQWLSTPLEDAATAEANAQRTRLATLRDDQDHLLVEVNQLSGEKIGEWPRRPQRGPTPEGDEQRLRAMNDFLWFELSRRRGEPAFPLGSGWESLERAGYIAAPGDPRVKVKRIGRPKGKSIEQLALAIECMLLARSPVASDKKSKTRIRVTAIEAANAFAERRQRPKISTANIWAIGRKR